jgi:hypothetical protein
VPTQIFDAEDDALLVVAERERTSGRIQIHVRLR